MITPRAGRDAGFDVDLEAVWPEVERRLTRYLTSRGVSSHDIEDLVQDCAVKVLAGEVAWTGAEDLLPWCIRVAGNQLVDLHRKRSRLSPPLDVDVEDHRDVHREVAARLSLHAVVNAWATLSARDRQSLADSVTGPAASSLSRKDAVRVNVARHRARQRLHALVAASLSALLAGARFVRDRALPATLTAATALTALLVLPHGEGGRMSPLDPGVADAQTRGHVQAAGAGLTASHRHAQTLPSRSIAGRAVAAAPAMLEVRMASGDGIAVRPHERPSGSDAGSVCLGGLPMVHDTCVSLGLPGHGAARSGGLSATSIVAAP